MHVWERGDGRRVAPVDAPASDDPVQTTLARIWAQVLGVPQVGVDDDFFALGGDSVKLVEMVTLARRAGLELRIRQALECGTIAALTAAVNSGSALTMEPYGLREVVFAKRPTTRRCHLILTSGEDLPIVSKLAEHEGLADVALHVLMPVWHESQPYVSRDEMSATFIRHMTKAGPPPDGFVVAGHCAAGALAARIVCDLERLGHPTSRLILLDSLVPGEDKRGWRLDDEMPTDPAAPDVLHDLRQEMARISRLRATGSLSPHDAMAAAWRAVSAAVIPLLSLVLGADARAWTQATRDEAARNFMAWMNLVIGMEEPLTPRLPADFSVTLFISDRSVDQPAREELEREWQGALGGSVTSVHEPGGHRALLHNQRLVELIAVRDPRALGSDHVAL